MKKETRIALEASIKHWEENVAATDISEVSVDESDCALCHRFQGIEDCYTDEDGEIERCPVYVRTDFADCEKTPYMNAYWKYRSVEARTAELADFTHHAKLELAFLKSLRPEKEI